MAPITDIAILRDESVTLLEMLMRHAPDAPEWRYIVCVSVFGNEIEEDFTDFVPGRWSTTWHTSAGDSAKKRLSPPADNLAALATYLRDLQYAHTEATGGPLDGMYFQVEVTRMQTRMSIR
jgi:hypothetical protein